ncbi:MAG: RDD family protein [Proteobacteria bacterium]|nr:RDD family protein [Pseudomonadota bacterium]
MTNNFITDNEIDRILGRITEYRKEPEKKAHQVTVEEKARLREEYARKKAQDFASNFEPSANTFSSTLLEKKTYDSQDTGMRSFTSIGVSAGIIRRVYAFCTDLCIVGLIMVCFVYGSMYFFGTETVNKTNIYGVTSVTWLLCGLYATLFIFYMIYFEGLMGQTPGKIFLNIRVVNSENKKPDFSTMIFRMVLFFILPLGLLGLHNLITKTRLVTND